MRSAQAQHAQHNVDQKKLPKHFRHEKLRNFVYVCNFSLFSFPLKIRRFFVSTVSIRFYLKNASNCVRERTIILKEFLFI